MFKYIIIAVVLSAAYFLSEIFFEHLKKAETKLVSFSSGLFITSIFLIMMPVFVEDRPFLKINSFFVALWGFVILHIFEKYVLQYSKTKSDYSKNKLRLGIFGQILNHLMLGYAITFLFMAKTVILGYLAAVPLVIYLFSSAVISEEVHRKFHSTLAGALIPAVSIFIGAIFAAIIYGYAVVSAYIFAFAVGVFVYIIVRDVMPAERKGNVFYFLYGIIAFFLMLGALELLSIFIK